MGVDQEMSDAPFHEMNPLVLLVCRADSHQKINFFNLLNSILVCNQGTVFDTFRVVLNRYIIPGWPSFSFIFIAQVNRIQNKQFYIYLLPVMSTTVIDGTE